MGILLMFLFGITAKDILVFFKQLLDKIRKFICKYISKDSVKNKMKALFTKSAFPDDDDDEDSEYYQDDFLQEDFSQQFNNAKQKKNKRHITAIWRVNLKNSIT